MNRKLRLDLDALEVESFDAEAALPDRTGTVRAHESTAYQIICTCDSDNGTCYGSCENTCAASCDGGCTSGTGGTNTREDTCATGFQIQCSCPYW